MKGDVANISLFCFNSQFIKVFCERYLLKLNSPLLIILTLLLLLFLLLSLLLLLFLLLLLLLFLGFVALGSACSRAVDAHVVVACLRVKSCHFWLTAPS